MKMYDIYNVSMEKREGRDGREKNRRVWSKIAQHYLPRTGSDGKF
jgi:hypothetical protein